MEAWEVIVIGGGHAALRSAISAKGANASVLVVSVEGSGNCSSGDSTGIASSISETFSSSLVQKSTFNFRAPWTTFVIFVMKTTVSWN